MPTLVESLKRLLQLAGLQARKQEGKVLLYNKGRKLLSRGILVADLEQAKSMVSQYLTYLRTVGFESLTDFAADHQFRPVAYREVDNQVDDESAYFINKEAMSSVDRVNLLIAARKLQNRVAMSQEIRGQVKTSDVRRYRRLKKVAAGHLISMEKV